MRYCFGTPPTEGCCYHTKKRLKTVPLLQSGTEIVPLRVPNGIFIFGHATTLFGWDAPPQGGITLMNLSVMCMPATTYFATEWKSVSSILYIDFSQLHWYILLLKSHEKHAHKQSDAPLPPPGANSAPIGVLYLYYTLFSECLPDVNYEYSHYSRKLCYHQVF